jgi:DNA repair exonuclease SbcCD ATPase subunit
VEPEEKGEFWQNLTKHKATKPVMAALNAMMRGHDFDVAISAFMAQLSNKIAKEDRRELDDFVRRSKEIFERYYQLRQSSFSDFLKAKNALMNAIFAFTRYKDLDSVLVEG